MSGDGLTPQMRATLHCIRQSFAARGVPPSYAEMAAALGLRSKAGVHRLVKSLEERGHITQLPYKSRSIALVDDVAMRTDDAIFTVLTRCRLSPTAADELRGLLGAAA